MAGIVLGCLACVFVFLAAWLALGWYLSDFALRPKPWTTLEMMRKSEFDTYQIPDQDWDANWKREDFRLQSQYGYSLFCSVFPREGAAPADGRERVVVIVHGHGVSRYCSAKYARMFRSFGFSVVVYDNRNHGSSGKALTTMGYCEARDLCTVCDWARGRFGQNCVLGTHGESMGAATVMLHAAMDHRLAFVVEDCGYSSLKKQLAYVMKTRYHLPPALFLPTSFFVVALRTGVWFQNVNPAQAVAQSGDTPMLFIHGENDTYVPYFMLEENYQAKTTGLRRKLSVPGAEHAKSFFIAPEPYRKAVYSFLRECGALPPDRQEGTPC